MKSILSCLPNPLPDLPKYAFLEIRIIGGADSIFSFWEVTVIEGPRCMMSGIKLVSKTTAAGWPLIPMCLLACEDSHHHPAGDLLEKPTIPGQTQPFALRQQPLTHKKVNSNKVPAPLLPSGTSPVLSRAKEPKATPT